MTWTRLKDALRDRLSPQAYATWVSQMVHLKETEESLSIGLPDLFALDWVTNHYQHVLKEELVKLGSSQELELLLNETNEAPESHGGPSPVPSTNPSTLPTRVHRPPSSSNSFSAPKARECRPPPSVLNDRYTFQTFVTGPSNQLAAAAAQSVADNPGAAYNPLFVFGRVGLGKTHLVQAIGHHILKRNPNARVQYQSTEQFVNDVIQGIRFERMPEIRNIYRACDVLMIDDIQFIAGKEACQAEFFHTFNSLYDARRQVVVTSDKLPHEIKDLEERVRSRFQWGLIVDLQPPELETRVAIVKEKAENDGINLSNDVAMFIGQSVRSNVRELEGCLIRVSAYATLAKQPITIDLAREVLKDVIPGKGQALTCETIIRTVSSHFDLKISDLKSTKRARAIALPRQIAMYLCRKHTASSYPEIGNALGGKDHTTALNAFNRIKARYDEPEVRRHVDDVERALLG